MTVLMVLIPLSLLMAAAALGAFAWSVRDGQLDDLASPGARLLVDDAQAHSQGGSGDEQG